MSMIPAQCLANLSGRRPPLACFGFRVEVLVGRVRALGLRQSDE